MFLQVLAEGFAQNAHTATVYDPDAGQASQERAVHELFKLAGGFVDSAPDDVDFRGNVCVFPPQGDRDAAGARGLHRGFGGANDDFGNVVTGDLHLHGADFDFEMIVIHASRNGAGTAYGFQLDGVAFRDVLDELRLRLWITLIRTRG